MFENAILVLLYNKEINKSSTLNSLMNLESKYPDAKVVIWNNGPNKLGSLDFSALSESGYQVDIVETIRNESLAVIYNRFMQENEAEKYILLDDDSELSEQFIQASAASQAEHLSLPIITSKGKMQYPKIDKQYYNATTQLKSTSKLSTIGSGMVIGKEVVVALKEHYNDVFDERFYLYGVDTTFCLRLSRSKLNERVKVIDGFEHSLSKLEDESANMTRFRRIERSYERGLKLRYYAPRKKAIYLLLKTGTSTLKRLCVGKKYQFSFLYVLKAFISGKHYRSDV